MGFKSHIKEKSKDDLKTEIRVLENSITDDTPNGDRVVIENRIKKLNKDISMIEDTVASDIANVETNLMGNCTGKTGCGCHKCNILKRKEADVLVQESLSFNNFFGK